MKMKKILTLLISLVYVSSTYAIDLVYMKERPSDIASNNVVKVVLESMGYNVNLLAVDDAETMWQAIADGRADGMLNAWLPSSHSRYAYKFEYQVENLGPNLHGTQVGLVVPTYVTIDSLEELNANADQFGGKIIGIEPEEEIMYLSRQAELAYGLEQFQLMPGNKNMMTNILKAAINNQQWIIATGWTPHGQLSQLGLKYLNDPKNIYGGKEQINTIVRLGLLADMPKVHQILDYFYWTTAELEQVMLWNQEKGADPYQNAKRWVRENQARVLMWIDKIPIVQPATYNVDTGHLHLPMVEIYSEGIRIGVVKGDMLSNPSTIDKASSFELDSEKLTPLDMVPIAYGGIRKRILERGMLICGIKDNLEHKGFAYLDENGHHDGFDVALCRAVAIAVLGNPEAIFFYPISPCITCVNASSQLDIVARAVTWTTSREARWADFIWIMFYNGQGFMVKRDTGITTIEQLDGETVCVIDSTTSERNLKDAFIQRGLSFTPIALDSKEEMLESYQARKCTAVTTDTSQLAEARYRFGNPEDHHILDITISKEPLSPVVPKGDSQWVAIVRTVMLGLINAEELGVTQSNVDFMQNSVNLHIRRLLGVEESFGQRELGFKKDAIANIIRELGNYGEIYERYMGVNGIGIPRGLNRLWTDGGLMYAPPLR